MCTRSAPASGVTRAALIPERLWVRERATVLTALGLDADPRAHLRELAEMVDDAYTQVTAGLAGNASVSIKGGRLHIRGWRPRRCRKGSRRSTTPSRTCCRASTTPNCCWRCTPGPACSTRWGTSPGCTCVATTWTSPSPHSLFILDAIHRLDAIEHPEVITTDQGSYSDLVYGMFAMCGYQFAPRHADITDTQL